MSPAPGTITLRDALARLVRVAAVAAGAGMMILGATARCAELAETIQRIKPSIVAIGTYMRLRSPTVQFYGTGFAVGDGRHVVTNYHVVAKELDQEKKEERIVLVSNGGEPAPRAAELFAVDKDHDIAVLTIAGDPLPAMQLGDSTKVHEGQPLAFTGFPIALVLGFHPATHRGMVAAITPVALPTLAARQLTAKAISRIRNSAYTVFQLDGTAYPGNSGSPLYDPDDGTVYGIINSVFVQGTREAAISRPSGITYAIPAQPLKLLLRSIR